MKTAFTTLACPEWSWETIVKAAVECGYDGIEVRGVAEELDLTRVAPFRPECIENTITKLHSHGLTINCLDTSTVFHDRDALASHINSAKAHIDLAAQLGAPYIRVFGDKVPNGMTREAANCHVAKSMRELGEYALPRNVKVLLETHGDFCRTEDAAAIVRLADHPAVGILWDMHHPYRFHGETIEMSWRNLVGLVDVVHVKDSVADGKGGHRLVLLGRGDVPIKECIRILECEAPDVWLSFEWEKRWHPEIESPEVALPHFMNTVKSYFN